MSVSPSPSLLHEVLLDAFARVGEDLPAMVENLDGDQLLWRPSGTGNSIGWLAWHLTRVQDDHIAAVGDRPQVYTQQQWDRRFALPYDPGDIGYGQSSEQVEAFAVTDAAGLVDYHREVQQMTAEVISGMAESDFRRVVDERWDPPVTAATRIVSVINDTTQHLGQIAYMRGLLNP